MKKQENHLERKFQEEKEMRKVTKRILTIVLALTMVMGMVLSVSASAIPAPDPLDTEGTAMIQKALKLPNGFNVPAIDYRFLFTPIGVTNDSDGEIITSGNPGYIAATAMPQIGATDATDAPAGTRKGIVTIEDGDLAKSTDVDGMQMWKGSVDALTAEGMVAGNSFPHAGVYKYTVSEINEGAAPGTGLNPNMKYSKASYEMYVYVENVITTDPVLDKPESLIIKNVGFRIMSVDGDDITTETMPPMLGSSDPDTGTSSKFPKHEPVFTNRFDPPVNLQSDKTVAGQFADTEKLFSYKLTVTRPKAAADVDEDQIYIGTIYAPDGPDGDTDPDVIGTVTVTFTGTSQTGVVTSSTTPPAAAVTAGAQFTMTHGQWLEFLEDNDPSTVGASNPNRTGLPAGSTYTIAEIGESRYTASVDVFNNTVNSTTKTETQPGTYETTLLVDHTGVSPSDIPLTLGGGYNITKWTNTHTAVTPTGILLNNLPFILLIVVALGGFVLYIASKRRKASN